MTEIPDSAKVEASPTKEFFISVLVRDITVNQAITDLVDNSIDGALRLRRLSDYNGLWVEVRVTEDRFIIADNCGGIPIEVARRYAFRFGRPPAAPATPHSLGQFGVGMKRAIFKLGSEFTVESRTENSHFLIEEDVNHWKAREDDWDFTFKD